MCMCNESLVTTGVVTIYSIAVLLFQQYPLLNTGVLGTGDLRKVYKAAWDARTKWYKIGLELDVDSDTLDSIEMEKSHIDDRFIAMLKTWLRAVNPRPTLAALAEALRSPTVGYGHLAEQILSLK